VTVWTAPVGTGLGEPGWRELGEVAKCLACRRPLWRLGCDPAAGGDGDVVLGTERYTLLIADGVAFRGRVDHDDPAYGVVVSREPFCRACHDAAPEWRPSCR
jgi:hypothetical protein